MSVPHVIPKAKSLKSENRLPLMLVLTTNFAILILAVKTGNLSSTGVDSVLREWREVVPAGVGLILIGIVNGLLSAGAKARLVFWRWSNPLPGSFAFSKYAREDPRIDLPELGKRIGPFPVAPREQNALWYKVYKSVADDVIVADVHRLFLFARDYTAVAAMLLVVAGGVGFWLIPSITTSAAYAGLLGIQYLLVRQAARNYGIRLVTTVMAVKSAS